MRVEDGCTERMRTKEWHLQIGEDSDALFSSEGRLKGSAEEAEGEVEVVRVLQLGRV